MSRYDDFDLDLQTTKVSRDGDTTNTVLSVVECSLVCNLTMHCTKLCSWACEGFSLLCPKETEDCPAPINTIQFCYAKK